MPICAFVRRSFKKSWQKFHESVQHAPLLMLQVNPVPRFAYQQADCLSVNTTESHKKVGTLSSIFGISPNKAGLTTSDNPLVEARR